MLKLKKFIPLTKVEEQADGSLFVYGEVTAERPDLTGEVMHYDTTAPFFRALVERFKKATGIPGMEEKICPLRYMHQLETCGAGKTIDFDDVEKSIKMGFRVYNDDRIKAVDKVKNSLLSGFSIGGQYLKQWKETFPGDGKEYTYYTADPGEVSLVDSPCLPSATFEYIKSDGSKEIRKFAPEIAKAPEPSQQVAVPASSGGTVINIYNGTEAEKRKKKVHKTNENDCDCPCSSCADDDDCANCTDENCDDEECAAHGCPNQDDSEKAAAAHLKKDETKTKRVANEDLSADCFAYVGDKADTSTWKLPIKFSTDAKTKRHVRNALSRFNQTKGIPENEKAKVKAKIVAAAKECGIKVADEAEKIKKCVSAIKALKEADNTFNVGLKTDLDEVALKLEKPDMLAKSLWDVKDVAGILMTLGFIQGSLAWERDMEGDNSPAPDDLAGIMEDMVVWFQNLVDEETAELLAATSGKKGEKAMEAQEFVKMFNELVAKGEIKIDVAKAHGAATHIHKAQGAVTSHVEKSVGAHTMHKEAMTKAFGAMKEACKALTGDALAKSTDLITKAQDAVNAHCDKMCKAAESHGETMDGHLDKALKALGAPAAGDNTQVGATDNEPSTVDVIGQGPTTGKAVTLADIEALLKKTTEESEKKMATLIALSTGGTVKVEPAPGIGDRGQIVKGTQPPVHQGGVVVVTPEQDAANKAAAAAGGANGGSTSKTDAEAQDLAKRAFVDGDPKAMLEFSKLRVVADSVPSHLQGMVGRR